MQFEDIARVAAMHVSADGVPSPNSGSPGPATGARGATDAKCPLCGVTLAPRYEGIRDLVTGEHFSVLTCGSCNLGVTAPRVTDLARYYGQTYWGGRHGFTAEYCARRRVKMLTRMTQSPPGSRVLDFGCGDGTFLRRAARAGWKAFGVEASFRPEDKKSDDYEVFNSLDGVRGRGPFEAITMWHVLEHLTDPLAMVRELKDLLAPGGVFIIGVPDADGVQARTLGADWMHLDVPRHLFHFGRTSLERLLSLASLSPTDWWNHEIEYDWMGWSQSALAKVGMPGAFFDAMTGRMPLGAKWAGAVAAGIAASAATLPLALKWGSSVTVAARRA
jgi:SAM-dependent methyltransferase